MSPDQDTRLDQAVKLASLAYMIASLLWLAWALMPEHQRRETAMRLMGRLRDRARGAAKCTGRRAITLEARSGCENYGLPYLLSQLAEHASAAYERLRYTF